MNLGDLLSSVPVKLLALHDTLLGLNDGVSALQDIVVRMRALLLAGDAKPIEPTFVYLLPPDGGLMGATRVNVRRGETAYAVLKPQTPIPAGAWLVCTGPALIRSVRVGNQSQDVFAGDSLGHVCQTRDALETGVHLSVVLALE